MRKNHKTLLFGASTYAVVLLLLSSVPIIYAQNGIAVTTDKNSFSVGDMVSISGKVDNAQEGMPVGIEVKDVDGTTVLIRTVTTDAEGNYELSFKVPSSSKYGTFTIFANAEVNGERVANTRNISVGSALSSSPQSSSNSSSGCLIATAAFGSELTPQVQFLRNFRDGHIMSTNTGTSFMTVFNGWYYSFSPHVADYEREQPWLQQTVKAVIYPLLGILTISEKAYSVIPGEYGSLVAGLVASSLIGAVYVSPLVLSIKQVRKNKLDYRIAAILMTGVIGGVMIALMINNPIWLTVTTSLLVLTTLALAAIYNANIVSRVLRRTTNTSG